MKCERAPYEAVKVSFWPIHNYKYIVYFPFSTVNNLIAAYRPVDGALLVSLYQTELKFTFASFFRLYRIARTADNFLSE